MDTRSELRCELYSDWGDEALLEEYKQMCVTCHVSSKFNDGVALNVIRKELLRRMKDNA